MHKYYKTVKLKRYRFMISSMTGFGRGEYIDDSRSITAEMKGVNHRYCDVYVKMPKKYAFAEEKIRSTVKERLKRGKIEVTITVDDFNQSSGDIRVNMATAKQYYSALSQLQDTFGFGTEGNGGMSLKLLAEMPDVIKCMPVKEDEDLVTSQIMTAVNMAVNGMMQMRKTEGKKLAEDILKRAEIISNIRAQIVERAPMVKSDYKDKMKARISELLGSDVQIPEERILVEAAVFADKADITEELVRLDSHINQLKEFVEDDSQAIGKKIDFLVQEMNREANTIGSKSNDTKITALMIDLKAEIEKIREQVQNIA